MTASARPWLTLFVRLVLVAMLVVYSVPAVGLAMHGDVAASCPATAGNVPQRLTDHAATHIRTPHHQQLACGDHHGSAGKQDCCSNFCLSLALIVEAPRLAGGPALSRPVHPVEKLVSAEPIRLDRPPADPLVDGFVHG